jgi:hypothetical protein
MLGRANDAEFLQLIWATDALQSGREARAKRHFSNYPPAAAAAASLKSRFGIHRWELETLIVQLLLTPKEIPREQGNLLLDCSNFEAITQTVNRLRSLENVESAHYLSGDFTIFGEMHRIGQRQFHWQRGYFNAPQVYRYAYLYGQGKCADFFQHTYGFEITDLIFTGFGLYSAYLADPWVPRKSSIPDIGLTDEIVQLSFPMISSSRDDARLETASLVTQANAQHGAPIPTALLPSILRKTPLIYFDDPNRLISPIPEAILLRVTAGLYYDLLPGGQDIINDANARFERYCVDLIDSTMDRFEVSCAYRYGRKAASFDSPDVLVKDQGKLVLVAECKATKLTYLAQFAENPFDAADRQYVQLAKAVFQLWRFFSHVRRGLAEQELAANCHGVVFTLDSFLQMAREPQNRVFAEANALADQDGDISEEDRKHITVCPVYDLEYILSFATEDSLLASLEASKGAKYEGWMLRQVHRDTGAVAEFGNQRPYPFDMESVLPWWNRIDQSDEEEPQE